MFFFKVTSYHHLQVTNSAQQTQQQQPDHAHLGVRLVPIHSCIQMFGWRRRRDSNPRDPSGPTPLAGERLRPLGHVSADPYICQSLEKQGVFSNFCRVRKTGGFPRFFGNFYGTARNLRADHMQPCSHDAHGNRPEIVPPAPATMTAAKASAAVEEALALALLHKSSEGIHCMNPA